MNAAELVAQWEARGRRITVDGHAVWMLDTGAPSSETGDPVLLLHGFPSCSYDWHFLVDALASERRIIALDFLGFGLSDKPDQRYSLRRQADMVDGVARAAGLRRVALVTHDMGDSVGGEVLARSLAGTLSFEISRRVLTNGSIYIEMAHLTNGQQLLLSLDDAPTELVTGDAFGAGLAGTFSPASVVPAIELEAQVLLAERAGGLRLLPRTIRYIEDRRAEERRYTGAIETHPSPLGVVWGADDPVAVLPMTRALADAQPDAAITVLDDVGHYPMIEAPERFNAAVRAYL